MNARPFLAVVSIACCCSAQAAAIIYSGHLSGAGESPPNASAGSGDTVVRYDAGTHMLSVQASFSGLSGNTTASHIHCCVTAGNDASGALDAYQKASALAPNSPELHDEVGFLLAVLKRAGGMIGNAEARPGKRRQ